MTTAEALAVARARRVLAQSEADDPRFADEYRRMAKIMAEQQEEKIERLLLEQADGKPTFETRALKHLLDLPQDQREQLAAYAIDPRAAAEAPKWARGIDKHSTHLNLLPELRGALDGFKIAAQQDGIAASTGTGITAAWSVVFAAGLRAILLGESLTRPATAEQALTINKALKLRGKRKL